MKRAISNFQEGHGMSVTHQNSPISNADYLNNENIQKSSNKI